MTEVRCPGCPLLLSDSEVSLVEQAIGKQAVWMFNKVWDERKNVVEFLGTVKKTQEMCRKENRVELQYWEFKEQEVRNIIKWHSEILDSVVQKLKGKVKAQLFQKILDYVEKHKDGLPK